MKCDILGMVLLWDVYEFATNDHPAPSLNFEVLLTSAEMKTSLRLLFKVAKWKWLSNWSDYGNRTSDMLPLPFPNERTCCFHINHAR